MATRSVRIDIGDQSYHLRFDPADVVAMEEDLGVGLPAFFRPDTMGVKFARTLLWRGLYMENRKGELIHALAQNAMGMRDADALVMAYLQDGGTFPDLFDKFAQTFLACGWFGQKTEDGGTTPKNSDGTGSIATEKPPSV